MLFHYFTCQKCNEKIQNIGNLKTDRICEKCISVDKTIAIEHSFKISVAMKSDQHPYFGKGSKAAYRFDGKELKKLELKRNRPYEFLLDGTTTRFHPFYFTTNSVGATQKAEGAITTPISNGRLFGFIGDESWHNYLYVQCDNHPYMGVPVVIV